MKSVSLTASLSRIAAGLFDGVRQLDRSLAELPGIEVDVLGLRDEFTEADAPKWSPLSVQAFDAYGPNQFGYAPGMRRALLEKDVDILHVHGIWMYPSVVSLAWHRRKRRQYMISPHGMLDKWALKNSRWKKGLALLLYERKHLERAACLRAVCRSEAESMRTLGLRNPVCVIPNGIHLPDTPQDSTFPRQTEDVQFKGSSFERFGEGRKVLLYLGRLHPKKGLENLLRAWAQSQKGIMTARKSEWLLAIAGWDQGGHETELKKLASELRIPWFDLRKPESTSNSLDPSAAFLGPQFGEAKAAYYARCDAFILPSFSEGLPMALLEAWAYSKPALMTPECNLPEGFDADAVIRIEPNVRSIQQGLHELFSMPHSTLQLLGENGRQLVSERFAWSRVALEMKAVYDWMLGAGPKPDCVLTD